MATTFTLVVSCEKDRFFAARETLSEIHQKITGLETELSEFLPESPVYQLNEAPPNYSVRFTQAGIELLEKGEQLRALTEGTFSIMAKSGCLHPRLEWNPETREVTKSSGTHVGFGAIGKGYALDVARQMLEKEGLTNYCLSAGGSSIVLSGFASQDLPWRWGWSWEKDRDGNDLGTDFSHHSGVPISLGVSGTQEKGPHLLDPRSQSRVNGPKSALVAHVSATEADALSTAFFIGGWHKTRGMMQRLLDRPIMAMIDALGIPRWNGLFQKMWGPVALLFFWIGTHSPAEEIDLSQLGMSDFTPYHVERNLAWALLPLLSLVAVFIHLRKRER